MNQKKSCKTCKYNIERYCQNIVGLCDNLDRWKPSIDKPVKKEKEIVVSIIRGGYNNLSIDLGHNKLLKIIEVCQTKKFRLVEL